MSFHVEIFKSTEKFALNQVFFMKMFLVNLVNDANIVVTLSTLPTSHS